MRKLAWFSGGFAAACLWASYHGPGAFPAGIAAALLAALAAWLASRPLIACPQAGGGEAAGKPRQLPHTAAPVPSGFSFILPTGKGQVNAAGQSLPCRNEKCLYNKLVRAIPEGGPT